MAGEITNPVTYADWAKTRDPDGNTADIVELLAETNSIIQDAYVRMSNKDDGHQASVRTGIPRGTWRKLNYGVNPSKSQTRVVKDGFGMLENYFEVDTSIANLEGDKAAFLLQEADGIVEGMNQDHVETLVYGDVTTHPERFQGFVSRYDDASAESGRNIINGNVGGGVSGNDNNTSILFMTWGPRTMFEFFPKGSNVGLQVRDLGEHTGFDAAGGRLQIYRSHFKHDVGFCLRDWRYGVRIANLDETAIMQDTVNLIRLLIKAESRIYSRGAGRTIIYCGREVYASLDVLANEKANASLSMMEWGTQMLPSFRGYPIRMLDAISYDNPEPDVAGLPTVLAAP